MVKTAGRTTVAASWFSLFDIAGSPGAGTLSAGNTANGVVPDDTIAGYPPINSFGGNKGYLAKVEFGSTVAGRIAIFDRLFVCGAYAFNANTTLASQPSYASRVTFGGVADYTGLEIWAETVTAATGNQTWNVTYTNQAGTAGKTTGATGIGAAPTVGRCWQLPFASGDSGVQKIENVTGGTGSAGTANIMVLRPLWDGRVKIANDGDLHDFLRTGLPEIFDTSALYMLVCPDSTAAGVPCADLTIAAG